MDTSLAERGQQLYEEKLKTLLEPAQNGQFIAIEPDTEKYFIAPTGSKAMQLALASLPDKKFYLGRIGYRAAHSIGGYVRSQRQT